MKFFILFLTLSSFLSVSAVACWAPCPEGKECYFEKTWLSKAELQKKADEACLASKDPTSVWVSTGASFSFTCAQDGNIAVQNSPNLVMRIRSEPSEEPNDKEENGPVAAVPVFHTDCKGQESCLAMHNENMTMASAALLAQRKKPGIGNDVLINLPLEP